MSVNLNPEKALIFRIVHVANVPWILEHDGLYSRNAPEHDPNYLNIGNSELIDKRARIRGAVESLEAGWKERIQTDLRRLLRED